MKNKGFQGFDYTLHTEEVTGSKPVAPIQSGIYDNLTRLYRKLGNLTIDELLIVKQKLEQVTTIYRTKDGLMCLAAACRWGKKHKLVAANLFEGMAQELPQYR